ncbi:MAG: histidine phosphatase family protein [Herpetosiphon sp.]
MSGVARHTVVYLVRHGQTMLNKQRRYLSYSDPELTPFGVARADVLGWHLRRFAFTTVVTSGRLRCGQTAEAILQHQQHAPVAQDDARWQEVHHGHWEGLTYREVMQQYAAEATQRFQDPWNAAPGGGETLATVYQRVREGWDALIGHGDGGRILLVAHATPLQLLLCDLTGCDPKRHWQFRLDTGSLSVVDLYPGAAITRTINFLPRLQG